MEEKLIIIETEYGDVHILTSEPIDPDEEHLVSSGRTTERLKKKLSEAMEGVNAMFEGMSEIRDRLNPDEFSLDIGVKIDVATGLFVIAAGSAVNFNISLKWKKPV